MNPFVICILLDVEDKLKSLSLSFLPFFFLLILKESLMLATHDKNTNIYYFNLLNNSQFNQPIPLYI